MLWELSTAQWIVSFGFICCLTYITGWLAEGLMKASGFGHIGNWILLLVGTYTAMYTFNMYGYSFRYDPLFTLACIFAGASAFFIIMCISKRLVAR